MPNRNLAPPTELSRLPRRDNWLILPTPATGTNRAAIDARAREHIRWPLRLERDDALFLCGPLLSRPRCEPGHEATAIRVADEDAARPFAACNSLVLGALRTFFVHHWRLNEGSIAVRISLGTATHDWR